MKIEFILMNITINLLARVQIYPLFSSYHIKQLIAGGISKTCTLRPNEVFLLTSFAKRFGALYSHSILKMITDITLSLMTRWRWF